MTNAVGAASVFTNIAPALVKGKRPSVERLVYLPKPVAVYHYVDVLNCVVRHLALDEEKFLLCHSGNDTKIRELVGKRGKRHHLNLLQPKDAAIRFLAKLGNVKIELIEPARDAILVDSFDHSMYWKYVLRHLVRPYKGRNDRVELGTTFLDFKGRRARARDSKSSWKSVSTIEAANTYYDGFSRKQKGWTSKMYRDRVCKRTGEVYCVHLERTVAGRHAISSVLNRIVDLIDDGWHRRFWRSRLQFRTLTARGLDLADAGGCLQRLVDRHHLRIEHGLSVLSNDDFLDDETATFATVSRDRSVFDGETDQRAIAYTGE